MGKYDDLLAAAEPSPVPASGKYADLLAAVPDQTPSPTPETDKAVAAIAAPRKPVESFSGDFRDPVASLANMIGKPLSSTVDVAKGFVTGIPDFLKAASDPWGPDSLHQMIGGGLQNAIAIEKIKNNQPFSQEWWNGVVPITAQIGMMAAGAKGVIEGGGIDASKIGSATQVPLRGVRPEMGQEASLRQQGETAQTQETPVLSPAQRVLASPEGIVTTPEGTQYQIPPRQTEGGVRIEEEEKANAVGETPPQKAEVLESPLASTAAPASPTSTVPESANVGEVPLGGVHAKAMAERPIELPEAGDAVGWEKATERGEAWLDAGGDPQKIIRSFRSTGKIGVADMGRMRAAMLRIEAVTNQAGDALKKSPNDPKLQAAYQATVGQEQAFANAYKPMHTVASNTLRSLQGKTPLTEDMAQSFTALQRKFSEINPDKPFTSEHATRANKLSQDAAKANGEYAKANGELYNRLDSEYGRIRSPRKGPPTLEDLGRTFGKVLDEVCDT